MTKRNSNHYRALEYLANHPEEIGVNTSDIITISIEQTLYLRRKFYCRVDLVYELKGHKAIIVEYKSNGHKRFTDKGNGQLERAVEFYTKIKGLATEGRLITGDSHPNVLNKIRRRSPSFETKSKNK